jgi:hypothetical protein
VIDFVGTPLDCAVLRPRPVDLTYDPFQDTTQCVWHTAVSGAHDPGPPFPAAGTPNYGVDWTGYLDEDGELYQYRGIDVNCDATDDANVRAIAFESWDGGDPEANAWTPAQIAKMKVAMTQLHDMLGIPYIQCPTWDAPGFGYHRLFPEWDKPFHYHSCPGDTRAQQWTDEIIPWLAQMAQPQPPKPTPAPKPTEEEMVQDVLAMYAFVKQNPDNKGVSYWLGEYEAHGSKHTWDAFMGAVAASGHPVP